MNENKEKNFKDAVVGIIMGSNSDWPTMKLSSEILTEFNIPWESRVVSAHRTPDLMYTYAKEAYERGIKVIIAGAGGSAHLPGMTAAMTNIPVIGVPITTKALSGLDSLYSIVQMPGGIPVATVAIGEWGAKNAGILAAQILATNDKNLYNRLQERRSKIEKDVLNLTLE